MRCVRVGVLTVLGVVLLGTLGLGVVAAESDEPFAVVPEGMHVETSVDDAELEGRLASELGVEERAVRVSPEDDTVEILSENVTLRMFVHALDTVGLEVDESAVRDRPTKGTMDRIERVIEQRYQGVGLEATVEVRGDHLLIDPAERGEEARERATAGGVRVLATVPGDDGHEAVPVLTSGDYRTIGRATQTSSGAYVPVTLTEDGGESFQAAMQEYRYDREGGTECHFDEERSLEENLQGMDQGDRCLVTVDGDEVVSASRITAGLATSFRDGSFAEYPSMTLIAPDIETARELELSMRTGPLPTTVTLRSADEVSWDGGNEGSRMDAVTADGPGFGPVATPFGVLGALVVARMRRRIAR